MTITDRPSIAQQENILSLLLHSQEHGKIVANLIDPTLFEADYKIIAERAVGYWNEHKQAPSDHSADLVADYLEDPGNRRANSFRRILLASTQLSETINAAYVLKQLALFTRQQLLKSAILQAAEVLNRNGSLDEVERILNEVLRQRMLQFDRGTRLDDDLEPFLEYIERHRAEFITGITPFDKRGIVPARGSMLLLIGGKGRGKSWFLVNCGKWGLRLRKRVLHITLEMSEQECRMRYYQALWAVPRRPAEISVTHIDRDRTAVRGLHPRPVEPEFTFTDSSGWINPNLRDELETRLELMGAQASNLIIKAFPNRSLTVDAFEGYLDGLEQVDGFVPDLVIIDYPKLMKIATTNAKDFRIGLSQNTERLRGLAVERNFALVVVDQLNREGYSREQARSIHVGEDWSQTHTADIVITHSATDSERRHGLARFYVDHARMADDKFAVLLAQNLTLGQFCIQSVALPANYFTEDGLMPRAAAEDTQYDDDGSNED